MKDVKRTSFAEFEKWFSKDGSIIPSPGEVGYEGFIERGRAWKAALEWAKSRIDYAGATNDMVDWIFEEELSEIT